MSSHLVKYVSVKATSLLIAKTICLLLSFTFIVCLLSAVWLGGSMDYDVKYIISAYLQAFSSYASFFVGLILGVRMNGPERGDSHE